MINGESYGNLEEMKKAMEKEYFAIPSTFVTNVLDSYIHHEVPCFPYYTDDEFNELCVCFLVRFSPKTWMVENKTKLVERLRKSYDDKVLLKELVLKFTRRKKWGKINFAMFLWMENVIEVGWEDF